MKKLLLITVLGTLAISGFAGDIATFTNLGFSENSDYFMFAQYGVESRQAAPYTDLFLVDVLKNIFVPGGVVEFKSTNIVEPGDNGQGSLFKVLEDNLTLTRKYGINHLARGRILYQLLNGDEPKAELKFRDFVTNNVYQLNLNQTVKGTEENIKSSFYIDLSVTYASGKQSDFKIGHAAYQREGVKKYKIRQIVLSPDEKALILIIEKEEATKTGINIRYMVETVKVL